MRLRHVALLVVLAAPSAVLGQGGAAGDVERANTGALEDIELGDWAAARRTLVDALAHLDAAGTGAAPAAARTHMLLGVVYAQGLGDRERGRQHLARAVALLRTVELDAHADAATRALWAEVQAAAPPLPEAVDPCGAVRGVAHRRIDRAPAETPLEIVVELDRALARDAVELHYRRGKGAFTIVALAPRGPCGFVATIPASAVVPPRLEYFVAARQGGAIVAAAGSALQPIAVAVVVGPAAAGSAGDPAVAEAPSTIPPTRAEDEVPTTLQSGRGKGGSCGGCAGAGAGETAALGLIALLLATRRPAAPRATRRRPGCRRRAPRARRSGRPGRRRTCRRTA